MLTEGTAAAGGGLWWYETPKKKYHETLFKMYQDIFSKSVLPIVIRKFKRRTVVQLACAIGLDEGDVRDLKQWVER